MTNPPDLTAEETALDHSGLAAKRAVVAVTLGAPTAAVAGASWSVAALGAEDALPHGPGRTRTCV